VGVFSVTDFSAAHWDPGKWINNPGWDALVSNPYFGFGVVMLLLTTVILLGIFHRRLWQFGITLPTGVTSHFSYSIG
jgi:hypothetical protein